MTFFQYLDVRFTTLSIEAQLKGFNIRADGEAKAVHFLVGMQRTFYKWTAVPRLIFDFFLVKLCVKVRPVAPELPKPKAPQPKAEQPAEDLKGNPSGPH